jgi:hypothetical protein
MKRTYVANVGGRGQREVRHRRYTAIANSAKGNAIDDERIRTFAYVVHEISNLAP